MRSPHISSSLARARGRARLRDQLPPPSGDKPTVLYDMTNTALSAATQKSQAKAAVMREFRERYAQLRTSWGGDPARWRGFDQWVARANNASFGAQAAYDELVPGLEALFERQGRDWQRFYDAVKHLATLPKDERHRIIKGE